MGKKTQQANEAEDFFKSILKNSYQESLMVKSNN